LPIFREFNHPLVRLNYDTGNTYFYCNGDIKIEEDIKYAEEYLSHVHLKDIRVRGAMVEYCPIGEGDLDFAAIIVWLKSLGRTIPCGLEIPVQCSGVLGNIVQKNYPLHRDVIKKAVAHSTDYVDRLLK
jgi:sugar phosphate isomerase/epimerase